MRPELQVPVDGKIADWPRRVANAIKALAGYYDKIAARLVELEGRVTDLEPP